MGPGTRLRGRRRRAVLAALLAALAAPSQAAPTLPSATTAPSAAGCPQGTSRVRSLAGCQAAAKLLAADFAATYDVPTYPAGCFQADGALWHNTNAAGAPHADAHAVCTSGEAADDAQSTGSSDDESCPAGGAGQRAGKCGGGASGEVAGSCKESGFDPARLTCETCKALEQKVAEAAVKGGDSLTKRCYECCQEVGAVETFEVATLIADASIQEKDQDLHDFIKRKAPKFTALEVEYQEGASPAIELESPESQPGRIVHVDVSGWKSEHLSRFLSMRLPASGKGGEEGSSGTAEIQSCSGWRLNQLPQVRRFIKEPGHADTYAGLKVNFIPHHNPDLVFFDEHGKEVERLDLGPYSTQQIHDLMREKGFGKKRSKTYRGEIRTCPGWRLNQLPDVRRFILGKGNADSYAGLRLNFVPHHSPVLIMYDEQGEEGEHVDIAGYSFTELHEKLEGLGLVRKEML